MLEIEGLSVRFGGLRALDDVALRVGAGEIVGLVGPNGAGKTTLFNVVSGTVRAQRGRIRFEGRDLLAMPGHTRARRGVGRTFQIPQPMHALTVAENLLVAQRFGAGVVNPNAAAEILALVGLSGKMDADAASELSLTELKSLEIAKALATSPRLLLLDEVFAGLETAAKRAFAQLLAEIHRKRALAMIVIEHDIETISTLCPRVAVLDFGRVIADGTPDAVFDDPAVIASYTGVRRRA
jgi:branched-chain amino acid transport system ATP-binding protein